MKTCLQIVRVFAILFASSLLSFGSYAAGGGGVHTENDASYNASMSTTKSSTLSYTPVTPAITPIKAPTMVRVIPAPAGQATTPAGVQTVAKVVWVKGTFQAMAPDSKTRSLSKDDGIYLHDTLITGADTEAQIVFSDDTLMTFRPSSNFYVNSYAYNPTLSKGKSVGTYVMTLVEGGFRTITGLIAKANPSDYKVNTPVATIGVRGTDYAVYLQNGQLFMGYYKGSPCVTNKNQTLCLDQTTPYATVPSADAVPVPLTQQPPQLGNKLNITIITYTAFTPPGSPSGPSTVTPSSVLNSFCIQ